MAEFPALPLWTDAYLSDTGHLTTIEHGAYLLLLMTMWRNGGSLPYDDKRLAKYCRMTVGQWQRVKPTLMEFFNLQGDQITQGRLTDELGFVRQNSTKQSNAAKARWLKTKGSDDATAMPNGSQTDAPTPTPTPTRSSLRSESSDPEEVAWWNEFWQAFPNKVGKPDAGKAFRKAIKRVDRETMMAGLRRYIEKPDDRPWCNPSTWLNQDRWADQPAVVGKQPRASSRPLTAAELSTQLLREMQDAERNQDDGDDQSPPDQHALPGPR